MTPKQLRAVIESTCQELQSLKLVTFYNTPCEYWDKKGEKLFVSWPMPNDHSICAYPFGTLEQFHDWIKHGQFTCLLFDNSIVRVSYECLSNSIVGHNLLYWPCPITFNDEIDNLNDLCYGLELCLDSPRKAADVCQLSLRSPMRFDYDPGRASEEHPEVHLHTQFEDTHIHVQKPMCFNRFIKTIFKTFYNEVWRNNSNMERLHDQAIKPFNGNIAPATHSLHIAWS